ncbi:MAG: DUF11 domain-containing protein, partial [Thermoleophilia bacterium]|nr:DUF11 domain-containing protein [Thermoleophilia bacterium]
MVRRLLIGAVLVAFVVAPATGSGADPAGTVVIEELTAPNSVAVGETITYTLRVRNDGPGAATNVAVMAFAPPGTTAISADPAASCDLQSETQSFACTIATLPPPARNPGQTVALSFVIGTDANTPSTVTFRVQVKNGTNTVSANVATNVVHPADVSLTKVGTPNPAVVGSSLTYTLTARNAGPGTAANVRVTDQLPGTVTPTSVTASPGSCSGT